MRFIAYVQTGGSKVERDFEIPDEDLLGLSDGDYEKLVDEHAHDIVFDSMMFEWGWREDI